MHAMPARLIALCLLLALSALLPLPAQAQSPLDAAEQSSAGDDPERRYLLDGTGGAFDVAFDGCECDRDPRVLAFDDACRGDVAHFVIDRAGREKSRQPHLKTPARLLGGKSYPIVPVTELPAWGGVQQAVARHCPTATSVLLSETDQIPQTIRSRITPERAALIGRVERRFALDLADPDGAYREVAVGGTPTLTTGQNLYYTQFGQGHAIGRSCDDLVATDRNYCPGVLAPAGDESHICNRDGTFCLVVPEEMCFSLFGPRRGTIGSFNRACIHADRATAAIAGIAQRMRDDPAHAAALAAIPFDRQTSLEAPILFSQSFIAFLIRDLPEGIERYCQITDDPADQILALNALQLAPGAYRVSWEELLARRPDLENSAGQLCALNNICASLAFIGGNEALFDIAETGLTSQLCSSAPTAGRFDAELRLMRFGRALERVVDQEEQSAAREAHAIALRLISHFEEGDRSPGMVEELREYLPVLDQAILFTHRVDVADLVRIVEASRR